jgi:hypothetical protein
MEQLTAATFTGFGEKLAADGTSVFFLKSNQIFKCPAAGAGSCTVTTPFMAAPGSPVVGLGIVGSTLYVAVAGRSGYTEGSIRVCPTGVSSCVPSVFVDKLGYPQSLAVDANGVYWYAADESALKGCPIGGCVNGQRTIATNITNPVDLSAGGGALYWAAPSTMSTNKIMRVVY